MNRQKETAIQKEQQSRETLINEIINEIIKIFADNNITIEEADKIRYMLLEKIKQQTVRVS